MCASLTGTTYGNLHSEIRTELLKKRRTWLLLEIVTLILSRSGSECSVGRGDTARAGNRSFCVCQDMVAGKHAPFVYEQKYFGKEISTQGPRPQIFHCSPSRLFAVHLLAITSIDSDSV